jgi:hypothetical protein
MTSSPKRKGMVLVGVIFLMAMILGLLSILTLSAGQLYRQQRNEQVRSVARAMADSGATYVHARVLKGATAPSASQPADTIELDTKGLLPSWMTGSLTVAFLTDDSRALYRVTARVQSAAYDAEESVDIEPRPKRIEGK